MDKKDAIDAIIALLKSDIPSLDGRAYSWPWEYSIMPAKPTFPFAVVNHIKARPNTWEIESNCDVANVWTCEILYFLARETHGYPSQDAADQEMLEDGVPLAINTMLWGNYKLSGTVREIGRNTDDGTNSFIQPTPFYMQWKSDGSFVDHWGIQFEFQIIQDHVIQVSP